MRYVGALLDNAQKLHAARRRDISIVGYNERPSDVIQYFTPLRHNRLAIFFSSRIYLFIIRTAGAWIKYQSRWDNVENTSRNSAKINIAESILQTGTTLGFNFMRNQRR